MFSTFKAEKAFAKYAMVAFNGSFIVFGGGAIKKKYNTIAKFDFKTWSILGELCFARVDFSVIFNGYSFLVVGGYPGRDARIKLSF